MAGYRLYIMAKSGRVERTVDLECVDDPQAIREALAHSTDLAMELRRGKRVVRAFPAVKSEP